MSEKAYCMLMRINFDYSGCFKEVRRALLKMQVIHSHVIDRKQSRVKVCGVFKPNEVAIGLMKHINCRIEILEIQEVELFMTYASK